jgi:hypothetical protein
MNPEREAWKALEENAASLLKDNFADHVMRVSRGPTDAAWQQLRAHGAAQIRPGLADRVMRAIRGRIEETSPFGHLALGALTVALCMAAVLFHHNRQYRIQEERNVAEWQQLASEAQQYFGFMQ